MRSIPSASSCSTDRGRFAEAEALFQHSLLVRRRVLGENNRNTLSHVFFLGDLYCTHRKWAEGEKMLLQAAAAQRRVLGDDARFTVLTMQALSLCYLRQEKPAEASRQKPDRSSPKPAAPRLRKPGKTSTAKPCAAPPRPPPTPTPKPNPCCSRDIRGCCKIRTASPPAAKAELPRL